VNVDVDEIYDAEDDQNQVMYQGIIYLLDYLDVVYPFLSHKQNKETRIRMNGFYLIIKNK
jgi:hypothetical protein